MAATPLQSAPSAFTGDTIATLVGLTGAVDLESMISFRCCKNDG